MLRGGVCTLRRYALDDAPALAAIADDPLVARWMRAGRFPSPYTLADAERWVRAVVDEPVETHFLIEVDGEPAGGLGILPLTDDEEGVATLGYWLGRRFWRRGVATDAVRTIARYAFDARGFRRIESAVYAPNIGSARVLEKAGFTPEGRLRAHARLRDGSIADQLVYGRLATDPEPDGSVDFGPESTAR